MIHKGDILPVQSSPGSKANLLANFSVLHHNVAHGSKKDLAFDETRIWWLAVLVIGLSVANKKKNFNLLFFLLAALDLQLE
jgi:hypothetical protein